VEGKTAVKEIAIWGGDYSRLIKNGELFEKLKIKGAH
jgi:hypothetical protein